jgi:hypothetical protein
MSKEEESNNSSKEDASAHFMKISTAIFYGKKLKIEKREREKENF